MKYMLLIYSDEKCWDEEQRKACMIESMDICRQLDEQGKFVAASPLHSVSTATSLRMRQGKPLVTDGPFAETTEQLGGFYIIDVKDLDEAISIAKLLPPAKLGTVEIRPIFDTGDLAEELSGAAMKGIGDNLVANELPFEVTIRSEARVTEIFECLTSGLCRWWSDRIEGDSREIGDVFKVCFDTSHKTFCVEDIAPGERVIWKCIDSHLDLADLQNRSECNGTNLRWEIERREGISNLKLSHEGLSPKLECFAVCKAGWAQYINGSLLPLLNGKSGHPFVNQS